MSNSDISIEPELLSVMQNASALEGKLSYPLESSVVFVMCDFILELVCKLLPVQANVRDGFARASARSQLSFSRLLTLR